ncbi:MAG TPA: PilN domain-containing protein [Burkholderiaceae bacterium]
MTQQINLIDGALLPAREWCDGRLLLCITASLLLGLAGLHAHERHQLARVVEAESARAGEPEPSTTRVDDASLISLQAQIAADERLLKALSGMTDLPRDNAPRLRQLFAAMPDSLWLREIEFSAEHAVRIAGGATQAEALAGFSNRLGQLPAFRALPLHVFVVKPRDRTAVAGSDETTTSGAPDYAFVLSSVDDGRQ